MKEINTTGNQRTSQTTTELLTDRQIDITDPQPFGDIKTIDRHTFKER